MKNTIIEKASVRLKKKAIDLISLADPSVHSNIKQFIPTSSQLLNRVMGGGVPCGRLTEIYGAESNGKSTLVADLIMNTQTLGGTAVVIDSEQAFHPERANSLGIKTGEVIYSDASTVEEAFEIIETILDEVKEEKGPFLLIWDSIAACTTKEELENDFDKVGVGVKARLISKGIRRLKGKSAQNTAIVIVNQVRTKIGGFYGPSTDTPGGLAIKFDASIRLELKRIGRLKDKDGNPTGIKTKATTVKNKIRSPFLSCEFDILFDSGINDYEQLLELLSKSKDVSKSGAWYTYKEQKFTKRQFPEILKALKSKEQEELYDKAFENVTK